MPNSFFLNFHLLRGLRAGAFKMGVVSIFFMINDNFSCTQVFPVKSIHNSKTEVLSLVPNAPSRQYC